MCGTIARRACATVAELAVLAGFAIALYVLFEQACGDDNGDVVQWLRSIVVAALWIVWGVMGGFGIYSALGLAPRW